VTVTCWKRDIDINLDINVASTFTPSLYDIFDDFHISPIFSTSMGKPISEEIQWIVIRLSTAMSREDIAMYTGISQRKIDNVLSTFNKYGSVKTTTRQKPHTYASLCDDDIQVCLIYFVRRLSLTSSTAPASDVGGNTGSLP
jgi:hypothetical protein